MLVSKYPAISLEAFDELYESLKNWNKWGPDDNLGTLNYITPERIRNAVATVKSGRTVSMEIPLNKTAGPDNPNPVLHYMAATHDIDIGSGSLRFATDFMGMQFHGDCHTHIDALCHIAYKGLLYNNKPASLVQANGTKVYDIADYGKGIVGRGVLIDVPEYRGIKWIEPGEAITREEIEAIEKAQGVRLCSGDILVLRTGHHRRRLELGNFNPDYEGDGRAGLDPYSMTLLHEREVSAFLPDGDGEVCPSYVEGIKYPIHPLQINAMGMCCTDSLQLEDLSKACREEGRYEFMVVMAPLRLPGGTGGPVNPIAIF